MTVIKQGENIMYDEYEEVWRDDELDSDEGYECVNCGQDLGEHDDKQCEQ